MLKPNLLLKVFLTVFCLNGQTTSAGTLFEALEGVSGTSLEISRFQGLGASDVALNEQFEKIAALESVKQIVFRNCSLPVVPDLTAFPDLQRLGFVNTETTDFGSLAALPDLRKLSITSVPATDFAFLSKLGELRQLRLKDTWFKKTEDLGEIEDLVKLDLRETWVYDTAPLKLLGRLKEVDLSGTWLDHPDFKREIEELQAALPDCVIEMSVLKDWEGRVRKKQEGYESAGSAPGFPGGRL